MSALVYTARSIAAICGQRLREGTAAEPQIRYLLTDSRQLLFPANSVFFALRGERRDGHLFVGKLYESGLRCFVVSEAFDLSGFPEAWFVVAQDPLHALQALAAWHRTQFDIPVIGITGSNGKTIVKEWLFQLLRSERLIVRSPGSFNSQIGVPLSVWQMAPEHELAIFEAGISRVGEMELLSAIIRCDTGFFLNLGTAHDAGFASRDEKLREKLKLFTHVQKLFYCSDDPQIAAGVAALQIPFPRDWSREREDAFLFVQDIRKVRPDSTILRCRCLGRDWRLELPFSQDIDIENVLHCIAYLVDAGYEEEAINQALSRLSHLPLRLELKKGQYQSVIINDAYSNDLESLQAALSFLQQQSGDRPRTLILSDFEQVNQDPGQWWSVVGELLSRYRIRKLITVGPRLRELQGSLPGDVRHEAYLDTPSLAATVEPVAFRGEAVLVKGARSFALERIARLLYAQKHRTTLEINLEALTHNVAAYARRIRPGVKVLVMLKAFAYGSGAAELGRLFEEMQADYIGVAYPDEGVQLREAGLQLPILVLNAEEPDIADMIRYRLEPEVFSMRQLEALAASTVDTTRLRLHLKLDTGMSRLGFDEQSLDDLTAFLAAGRRWQVASVFTHLAASEDPEEDEFSATQFARFDAMNDRLQQVLGYQPWRHALNSAGILRFPDRQYEMVRIGIGMYGVDPVKGLDASLYPVHTLKAVVSQIRTLSPGQTVGYSRTWAAGRPSRIATITIGYADGLLRSAGNSGYAVWFGGRLAPVVGRVCMDMSMIDVSDIPDMREGDEVILFGPQHPISVLASTTGSSPYELLSRIAERVNRIYTRQG